MKQAFSGILQESPHFDYLPFEFLVSCTFRKICPLRLHKMQSNECQINYLAYFMEEKYSSSILLQVTDKHFKDPLFHLMKIQKFLKFFPLHLHVSADGESFFKNVLMLYCRINKCNNFFARLFVKDFSSVIVSKGAVKPGYFSNYLPRIFVLKQT